MLVYRLGTPTWRMENSVNIWNLLSLSRPVIREFTKHDGDAEDNVD